MILLGTIPEIPISREWSWQLERPLGVVPTAGRMPTGGFVNRAVTPTAYGLFFLIKSIDTATTD